MKQILRKSGIVFVIVLMNAGLAQADYDKNQHEVIWFSTSTSGLLTRSSIELATKHVKRGIRFAHKALQKELNPTDQLIANHNLCLGYSASNRTNLATPYCARAIELAQGPFSIVKVRGSYLLSEAAVKNNTPATMSLVQVVVSNIQQQHSQRRLTLLIK